MTHIDLEVWKRSIKLVTNVYKETRNFPKEEVYGLTSQIRRSAVSIPSNIAEGAARRNKTEFRQFLYIALGSASELETQFIIAKELFYIEEVVVTQLLEEIKSIGKMIIGLIKSLNIN
jgi:four helix bundle protein